MNSNTYNTNNSIINNIPSVFSQNNYEKNTSTYAKKKRKKIIAIIISIIAVLLIAGIIILIVCLKKGKNENSRTGRNFDDGYDDPIVNVSYKKDEIKFFNVEKNISSKIKEENELKEEMDYFNYICILGVQNQIDIGNDKNKLYEGFFAILSTSLYNKTTHKYQIIKENGELKQILNNNQNIDYNLLRYLDEYSLDDEENDEEETTNPFLKIVFIKMVHIRKF